MSLYESLKKIKIKEKEREYKKYISHHRELVNKAFYDLIMCPNMQWMYWTEDYCVDLKKMIDKHDLSKYNAEEFNAYRRYYHPIDTDEKQAAKEDFKKAWEHHWKNNRHHWEARQNDSEVMTTKIQMECLENVIDWMATGYLFHNTPKEYYNKHKNEIKLPDIQRKFIEKVIYEGINK